MGRHSRADWTPDDHSPEPTTDSFPTAHRSAESETVDTQPAEPGPAANAEADIDARHRGGDSGRRVSRGPVIATLAVVLVAALTFGWLQLGKNVDSQAAEAAATCVDGDKTVEVAADTDIFPALEEIAARYNDTGPVIRDFCIKVRVNDVPSATALTGLQKKWNVDTSGPVPAAWVAADSSFTDRLAAADATSLDGNPTSVARSPLVLSVPEGTGAAITDSPLTWGDLPELQGDPDAWARFGESEWGELTVALPAGTDGSTSAPMTAQAVAAGVTDGSVPTVATLREPAVSAALTKLGQGPDPESSATALTELATTDDVAGSAFQAVPATEQQVFAIARTEEGRISAALLDGPAPVADYPFALLSGDAVDDTQSRAAAAFEEFVTGADAQQVLADDGFRTTSKSMPDGGTSVSFGPLPDPLGRTDVRSADALTAALSAQP